MPNPLLQMLVGDFLQKNNIKSEQAFKAGVQDDYTVNPEWMAKHTAGQDTTGINPFISTRNYNAKALGIDTGGDMNKEALRTGVGNDLQAGLFGKTKDIEWQNRLKELIAQQQGSLRLPISGTNDPAISGRLTQGFNAQQDLTDAATKEATGLQTDPMMALLRKYATMDTLNKPMLDNERARADIAATQAGTTDTSAITEGRRLANKRLGYIQINPNEGWTPSDTLDMLKPGSVLTGPSRQQTMEGGYPVTQPDGTTTMLGGKAIYQNIAPAVTQVTTQPINKGGPLVDPATVQDGRVTSQVGPNAMNQGGNPQLQQLLANPQVMALLQQILKTNATPALGGTPRFR